MSMDCNCSISCSVCSCRKGGRKMAKQSLIEIYGQEMQKTRFHFHPDVVKERLTGQSSCILIRVQEMQKGRYHYYSDVFAVLDF